MERMKHAGQGMHAVMQLPPIIIAWLTTGYRAHCCAVCCTSALVRPVTPAGIHVQVRLLLLAAMAGEHILLIGPPGTAKSEVGRRLSRLVDGQYFERLLTRFSVPEVSCAVGSVACEMNLQGGGSA
jgi:hypothetical protein